MSAELKRRFGTSSKLAYTSFTNITDGANAYNFLRIYKALISDGPILLSEALKVHYSISRHLCNKQNCAVYNYNMVFDLSKIWV